MDSVTANMEREAGVRRGEEDEGWAADAWAPDVSVTPGRRKARAAGPAAAAGLGPSGSEAREEEAGRC
jgi:hypothetical protein